MRGHYPVVEFYRQGNGLEEFKDGKVNFRPVFTEAVIYAFLKPPAAAGPVFCNLVAGELCKIMISQHKEDIFRMVYLQSRNSQEQFRTAVLACSLIHRPVNDLLKD